MRDNQAIKSLYTQYASDQLRYAKQMTSNIYLAQAAFPLFGISFIFAFIINNLRYSHVYGTWLQSHFRWQIQTFVFGMIWGMTGGIIVIQSQHLPSEFSLTGYTIISLDVLWIYYRIIKGRIKLAAEKQMYAPSSVEDIFEK